MISVKSRLKLFLKVQIFPPCSLRLLRVLKRTLSVLKTDVYAACSSKSQFPGK